MSSFRSGEPEGNQSVEFPVKSRHTELNHTYDSVKSPPVPKRTVSIANKSGGYVIPARRFPRQEDPTEHYLNVPKNPRSRNLRIGRGAGLASQESTPHVEHSVERRVYSPSGIQRRTPGRPEREVKVNANSPHPQKRSEFDPPTTMGNLQGLEKRSNFAIPIQSLRMSKNSSTTEASADSRCTRCPIPAPRFQKERRPERSRQITVPFSRAVKHPTSRSLTTGFLRELETVDPTLNDIFQQCGVTMERHAKQVADGHLIFTSDCFACGMFDHHGGYLPLPFHKVSLYVTPHAIVGDEQEPIFIYVLPESAQGILVVENGEEVISSTIVCGKTGHKFSSDVVLSFPLSTQSGGPDNSVDQQVIVWEYGLSMDDKPKQQVMDKILDCFYSIKDNRCTLMVNELANFTVISKAERQAEGSHSHYPKPSSDESVSLRVGVFGRQIAGTGSAQIRVIFWKDSDLETKRTLSEEQRDGFSKLDRVRVIVINRYSKAVWVAVINVIPGWSLLSKDKENFTVEHILSQNHKDGRFPSCTFALYRSGGPGATNTPHVAACTIEVSQDDGDEYDENEDDTIQLVAVVERVATNESVVCDPGAPSVTPRKYIKDSVDLPARGLQEGPSPGKGSEPPVDSFPDVTPMAKPSACMRYQTLGELALHLEVSDISGRCWKLLARNMGLSAQNICCLSERYLCPGEAVINWYLGQQMAIVAPREALRTLLDLFRDMKWPELQAIVVRELRLTENQNQGLTSSTHLKTYEIIDGDNQSQSPGRSVSQKVEVHTPPKCLNQGENRNKALLQGKSSFPSPRLSAKQSARGDRDKDEHMYCTGPTEVQGSQLDIPSSQRDYDLKSQLSGKVIIPKTCQQGFSYDMPLTQLPSSKVWRSMQNVTSVKESTMEESTQLKNPEVPAVVVTGVTSQDITLDEENPYLQPDRKKVQLPTHRRQPSQSVKLKKDCDKIKLPIPPARSSSVMTKKGQGVARKPPNVTVRDTSLVDSKSNSKSMDSLKDKSTDKQNEHKRTYITSAEQLPSSAIPLLQPHQDYRAPGNLQRETGSDLEDNYPDESTQEAALKDAPSLIQTKLKNLHKVVKKNLKKKHKDDPERPRQDSLSGNESTDKVIYDDIASCSNQVKEPTMADASGERQYGEQLKQLSKDLLAKIALSTTPKKEIIPSKSKFGMEANDYAVGLAEIGAGTRSNQSRKTPHSTGVFTDSMTSYEDINDTTMHQVGAQTEAKLSPNKSLPKGMKPCTITEDMECYEAIGVFQKQAVPAADQITLALIENLPKPCAQSNDKKCYAQASTPEHPVYKTGTDQLKPVPKVKKIPSLGSSPNEQRVVVDDMISYEDVSIPEYPLGKTSEKFKPVSKMKTVPETPPRKNTDYRIPTDDMVTYEDVPTTDYLDGARMDKLKLVSKKDLPKVTKKPQTSHRTVTDEMTTYEDVTEPESQVGTSKSVRKKQLAAIPPPDNDNPCTAIVYTNDLFNTSEHTTTMEHSKLILKTPSPVIPPRYPDAAPDDNYEDISIPVHLTRQTKSKKLPAIPPRDQKRLFSDHHTTTRTDHFKPIQGRHSPVVPLRSHERSHAANDAMVSYEDVTNPEHHVKEAKEFKLASKLKVPAVPPRDYAKPPAATYDTVPSGDVSMLESPNEARINQFKANSRERAFPTSPPDHTHGSPRRTDDKMTSYEDMSQGPARTRSDLHSKPKVTEDNMPSYEDMAVPQYPGRSGSDQIKVVRTKTGKLMPVRVFVPKQKLHDGNY